MKYSIKAMFWYSILYLCCLVLDIPWRSLFMTLLLIALAIGSAYAIRLAVH
jgi:hypothetical protein